MILPLGADSIPFFSIARASVLNALCRPSCFAGLSSSCPSVVCKDESMKCFSAPPVGEALRWESGPCRRGTRWPCSGPKKQNNSVLMESEQGKFLVVGVGWQWSSELRQRRWSWCSWGRPGSRAEIEPGDRKEEVQLGAHPWQGRWEVRQEG